MNILALGIAICLSIFIGLFWVHHSAYNRNLSSTVVNNNSRVTKGVGKAVNVELDEFNGLATAHYPFGMSVIVLIFSISIYANGGHFQGWDQGRVDDNVDYLVAANITKERRLVEQQPQDEMALMALAQSYAEGGLYADSVDTLTLLISLVGNDPELLGMKATSMYYRDARTFGPETKHVIDTALSIQSDELHTRMLLATNAYLNGQYAIAIKHWQILLTNQSQPFNRQSITNAIIKAEFQLNEVNQ